MGPTSEGAIPAIQLHHGWASVTWGEGVGTGSSTVFSSQFARRQCSRHRETAERKGIEAKGREGRENSARTHASRPIQRRLLRSTVTLRSTGPTNHHATNHHCHYMPPPPLPTAATIAPQLNSTQPRPPTRVSKKKPLHPGDSNGADANSPSCKSRFDLRIGIRSGPVIHPSIHPSIRGSIALQSFPNVRGVRCAPSVQAGCSAPPLVKRARGLRMTFPPRLRRDVFSYLTTELAGVSALRRFAGSRLDRSAVVQLVTAMEHGEHLANPLPTARCLYGGPLTRRPPQCLPSTRHARHVLVALRKYGE